MKKLKILGMLLVMMAFLTLPASANAIVVPDVPEDVEDIFPEQQEDFAAGVLSMIQKALDEARPGFLSSIRICVSILATALLLSVLRTFQGKSKAVVEMGGVLVVTALLLGSTNSMIEEGTKTVSQISDYGKLLLPVMTAALASQGGTTTAATIYTATAFVDTCLCSVISSVLIPAIYVFLAFSVMNALTDDGILTKLKDLCKWAMSWFLKIVLYGFTGYMAISGVISGGADQTAIKATKLTISGVVPVVGGILSDASETILVGAGVVKNTAGVYGMLAILAVTILPFLTIGGHYLLLKITSAVSSVFAPKTVGTLLEDFASSMGLILAVVGTVSLIQMISVVCFLKGMS